MWNGEPNLAGHVYELGYRSGGRLELGESQEDQRKYRYHIQDSAHGIRNFSALRLRTDEITYESDGSHVLAVRRSQHGFPGRTIRRSESWRRL